MGSNRIESIVGKTIGIFHILYECELKSNDGHKMYHIKCCLCGYETNAQKRHIENIKMCKHIGLSGNKIKFNSYNWQNNKIGIIFRGMKSRCYNKNHKNYILWGGKGIKICKEWIDNPSLFEKWAINNGYENGLTIDRIDGNKNYEPNNCRWVSRRENSKNIKTANQLNVNGVTNTGNEWSKICLLGKNTINEMVKDYPKEKVIEFICKRLEDKTKTRKSHQTWMQVYDVI